MNVDAIHDGLMCKSNIAGMLQEPPGRPGEHGTASPARPPAAPRAEPDPAHVAAIRLLPGLGPKRVSMLLDLHIASLEELKVALQSGRLQALRGFGEKQERRLLEEIEERLQEASGAPRSPAGSPRRSRRGT